jgi:hypothetical protein
LTNNGLLGDTPSARNKTKESGRLFMKIKSILTVLAAFIFIGLVSAPGATTYTPGSEDDPVVTKSYVDGQIATIKQYVDNNSGSGAATYKPLQVAPGKTLIGGEGTEIILRSGEATAIDNGSNGISDITAGKDLWTGNPVALNHLLLIPRADGRGIKATTDIWVLIRGSYETK